jgi:hypothetical protein
MDVRKPLDESVEVSLDSGYLRLLKHDFAHPHAVGIA